MVSLCITGCMSASVKKDVTEEINIEKDDAKELTIQLVVGYGEVNIVPDAADWVEGTIKYNLSNLKPDVTYKVTREIGKISIKQSSKRGTKIKKGQIKNNWDLALTKEVPISLKVETGASDTNLDLRGLKLSNLTIDAGVGRTKVDLREEWEESFDVNVTMGVGESTIILPRDVGVKVHAEKGIGATNFQGLVEQDKNIYVNEAFHTADTIITVNAEIGVGKANFIVEGN